MKINKGRNDFSDIDAVVDVLLASSSTGLQALDAIVDESSSSAYVFDKVRPVPMDHLY